MAHTWNIARTRGLNTFRAVLVQLIDADGTVGLGEAAPASRYKESVDTVESFLNAVDPTRLSFNDLPGSATYLNSLSAGNPSAKCALNVALLDGATRRARKPIYDFLNLGFREKAHVTSFTIAIDKPDVVRQKVLAANEYPILKMKVGVPEDKENLRHLREAAPHKTVRVDANEGWKTREHALEMIEWLAEDRHIEFIEQPMPASVPAADWVWLKERSPLPIFADESYHHADDVRHCAECFHGVNVKLVKAGGILPAFEALRTARAAGLKTMLGCMIETSVLISAAAHLAELCDHLDLDGHLLITNDPFVGVTARKGIMSFADAPEPFGLRVCPRPGNLL